MYLYGFGNHHQTECIKGALPADQNSPQQCAHQLYAEQLSGSAFTRPRHLNLRTWLYRQLPSVAHPDYQPYQKKIIQPFAQPQSPNPMRWSALSTPEASQDFIDGLSHISGTSLSQVYIYQCNQSMQDRYFINQDGEFLFIPYSGALILHTEMGRLEIKVGMIAVIPRGIAFKVELVDNLAAGYLCEHSGLPLVLPQLGPIGANGLANPRHFFYPTAALETKTGSKQVISKYQQHLWEAEYAHSPLNVAAWQGNYAPYGYDLSLFNTIQTVSFDHPDPSIFTVLTSESPVLGTAQLDFVIFPPRWMVANHTFRPPYFHRNVMSELMGLVQGQYDAKPEGFEIGGISIHNCMTPHGPDVTAFENATAQDLKPEYYNDTMAFMLESCDPWLYTEAALQHPARQKDYSDCWQGFK
ncbi:MAG: homogentisate 1,2-dioxygenase [Gammaproteobacteria bacterium]|nr:homogentisate 1,2-dioxygenase [Gammaproteobacteria bacterium]